jgi:hypothetical protein
MRGYTTHPAGDFLKSAMNATTEQPKAPEKKTASVLDGAEDFVMDSADAYTQADVSLKTAAAMQEFAEITPDDLDTGEGMGDRLFAMFVGIVDADMDGEIGDDEADALELVAETAWDYLAGKGVPEDDIDALLNDYDNDVAARVQELLAERLPEGDDAAANDMETFAFGDGSDEAALDAVYKKKVAFRKGKKVMIRKRVSGTVRLSAKQKMAVRKMLRKTHSAGATMRRAKSMRMRRKAMK